MGLAHTHTPCAPSHTLTQKKHTHTHTLTPCAQLQVTQQVCVFLFDVMYLDGEVLMPLPLRRRRELIHAALPHMREGFVQVGVRACVHALRA